MYSTDTDVVVKTVVLLHRILKTTECGRLTEGTYKIDRMDYISWVSSSQLEE